MLVSNIEPYKLYTTEDLARILGYHTQSIYQDRVPVPQEHDKDNPDQRTRRWLGLVIINWLRIKSGLPSVEPVFNAAPAHVPAPATEEVSAQPRAPRAIRLPKRKPKQRERVGGAS
jgi:hypothetical protein